MLLNNFILSSHISSIQILRAIFHLTINLIMNLYLDKLKLSFIPLNIKIGFFNILLFVYFFSKIFNLIFNQLVLLI